MNKKLMFNLIFGTLLLFSIISFTAAATVTDVSNWASATSSGSTTGQYIGFQIQANVDGKIYSVGSGSAYNGDVAYIYQSNANAFGSLLGSATISGSVADFSSSPIPISLGNKYYVVVFVTGAVKYGAGPNVTRTAVNYTGGYQGSGDSSGYLSSAYDSVHNITTTYGLIVTLNSPPDLYYSNDSVVKFNATVTSSIGNVNNATLFINGNTSIINTTVNAGNYIFSPSAFADGVYNWSVGTCSNGYCINSTNRTFTIDTIPPIINITNPYPNNSIINYQIANQNIQFNWTVSDLHLNSCWVNYGGLNHTVTCSANTTNINLTSDNINNATFFANDTAGNVASTYWKWNYNIFQNLITYSSPAVISSSNTFTLNFLSSPVSSATITFNGVTYPTTLTYVGMNNYLASENIQMPSPSISTNYSFYFTILQNGTYYNSSSYNVTVIPFSIDTCGTNTYHLLNYDFKDEDTRNNLSSPNVFNLSTNIVFYSSPDLTNLFYNYSVESTNINSLSICSSVNLTSYGFSVNIQNKYNGNSTYNLTEFSNIQNLTLSSSKIPLTIDLYALKLSEAQFFQISWQDNYFKPQANVLISLERYYPSLNGGTYITVQSPITDSFGNVPGYFITNNQQYSIVVSQNGNILATYPNYYAICQNPTFNSCSITLNQISSLNQFTNFTSDISYTYSYTNTSFTTTFSSGTGQQHLYNLTGYSTNGSQICSSSIDTSAGSLTCSFDKVSDYTNYRFVLTSDNNPIFTIQIPQGQTLGQVLGNDAFFFGFLIILLLGLVFIGSTIMSMIGVILGLIAVSIFTLTKGGILLGSSIGVLFLVLAGIIIIWKMSKEAYGR